MNEEKLKKLQLIDAIIKKELGEGVVREENEVIKIPRWALSSPNLNYILGGGIPKGRIIEMYGTESGGKTTLSTLIAADIQKKYGGFIVFVDAENSFDYEWANKLGLNTDSSHFRLVTADSGNDALEASEKYAASGVVDYIIVDSVAALTPKSEIEGEYGDSNMGVQARLMSQSMRKLTPIAKKNNCTIVFINQLRMKIGVTFGNPETTTGGNALKFYSSIRLDVRRVENLDGADKDDDVLGIKTRVKCIKNKTAQPFRKAEIDINFSNGIDIGKEYLDFAVQFMYIDKSGSWYSYKKDDGVIEKLGQGKDNVSKYLLENPEIFEKIKKRVDMELRIDNSGIDEKKDEDVVDKKEKRKYTKKEEEVIILESKE